MHEVAQGNANVVYETNNGQGIRVSKSGVDPKIVSEYWNSFWIPKLGKYMGPMAVVDHPQLGSVLSISIHGSKANNCEIVGEFKPKWLTQSSRAPIDALCCRTCAIKKLRDQECQFCCLDLGQKEHIDEIVSSIVKNKEYIKEVSALLKHSDLLDLLKFWQQVLDTPDTLKDCMSARDCTIMIERNKSDNTFKLFVVDLDPKLDKNKPAKWERLENELQPYYLQKSSTCRLSR